MKFLKADKNIQKYEKKWMSFISFILLSLKREIKYSREIGNNDNEFIMSYQTESTIKIGGYNSFIRMLN